jgi:hypothetical protein
MFRPTKKVILGRTFIYRTTSQATELVFGRGSMRNSAGTPAIVTIFVVSLSPYR